MKTKQKTKTNFSRKWRCRAMSIFNPEGGVAAPSNRGFTMIELLMVIAILSVLALLAIPAFSSMRDMAKSARCKSEVRGLEQTLYGYNLDNQSYPNLLSQLPNNTIVKDPWGRDYQYSKSTNYLDSAGNLANHDFDLYSLGSDGNTTGQVAVGTSSDDIVRVYDGESIDISNKVLPPPPP